MEIIARSAAIAANRTKFYTGKPCRYGHDVQRYTSSGACITCTERYRRGGKPATDDMLARHGFQQITLIVHHEDISLLTDMAAGLETARRAARDAATAMLIARTRASVIGGTGNEEE